MSFILVFSAFKIIRLENKKNALISELEEKSFPNEENMIKYKNPSINNRQ